MDLEILTHLYAEKFSDKDLVAIEALMDPDFVLSDGEVSDLGPRQEVISYISNMMQSNKKRFRFEVLNVDVGGDFSVLEFELSLDEISFHGVDIIRWRDGVMIDMKAFLNEKQT